MNDHQTEHNPASGSPEERRQGICRLVEQRGSVRIEDVASLWGVQPITIRRDLDVLADEGCLIRVRGGAMRSERVRLEFNYADRIRANRESKAAIAKCAAEMIQPGQTIILDTGTTTQLLARELVARTDLQIVTNSMVVVHELRSALGVNVVLLGGQARRGGFELVGPITERLLADLRADIAFLGADAVDPASGFYTTDLGVARVEELMIGAAATAVVAADASKVQRRAFARYASFEQIDLWITSPTLPPDTRRVLQRKPIEIVEVPASDGGKEQGS